MVSRGGISNSNGCPIFAVILPCVTEGSPNHRFWPVMSKKGGSEGKKMRHHNDFLLILLIIVLIPAVLALHKGVRTVVVPTTPECLAGLSQILDNPIKQHPTSHCFNVSPDARLIVAKLGLFRSF